MPFKIGYIQSLYLYNIDVFKKLSGLKTPELFSTQQVWANKIIWEGKWRKFIINNIEEYCDLSRIARLSYSHYLYF